MALVYRTQQLTEVYANSGYWADIQNAVDQAAAAGGGNVYIPEGTWNFVNAGESWSGSRVNVPAGVSIFGAPTNKTSGLPYDGVGMNPNDQVVEWKTVLVIPWDLPSNDNVGMKNMFRIYGTGDPAKPSRISDIKFVGYRSINSSSTQMPRAIRIEWVANFRVDHCYFENMAGGGVVAFGRAPDGNTYGWSPCYGVIDHCYFVNSIGLVAPYDSRTVDYGVAVARAYGDWWDDTVTNIFGKYTEYTVFVEDCYFSKWRHCTAASDGAHYVLRHSTIENSYAYGDIDAHGTAQVQNGVITRVGTRAVEIYNCKIINGVNQPYGQVYAAFIRGGAGIAFNNTVGGGVYVYFIQLSNEAPAEVSKCWINDWYIWSNTMLNGCIEVTKSGDGNIQEGVNYFRYAPSWYTPYPYPHPLTQEAPPSLVTPWTETLEEGTYKITMPQQVQVGSDVYNFKQWEDGSTNPVRTISLTSDMTITATYEKVVPITHILSIIAGIGGTTNPSPANYTIVEGQQQQVTAIPDTNYKFINWLLDGVVRTENPIIVTMDTDHNLEAVFEYVPPPLTATIKGIITDHITGLPVAGATVTCDGYADVTEVDGSYIFENVPAQKYTIKVTKENYTETTLSVDASSGGTITMDVSITPTPTAPSCFIVTVAFGSPFSKELNVFRRFRDKCLPEPLTLAYYRYGRYLAQFIKDKRALKRYVRQWLTALAKLLKEVNKWSFI